MSFADTIKIMNKRRNTESDITNKELEEIKNAAKEQQKVAREGKKAGKEQTNRSKHKGPSIRQPKSRSEK